ncbi:universal stress protein [Streptomyces sp. NPDC005345]|uniref:universal stress protein n=1 Tax=Streptomyces sp. NPDC005345 TaxID=3156877 RepID=UPI0033A4E37A
MATVPGFGSHGLKPVVVGVSRSEASKAGVAWAAEEAVLRHLPLRLVHALEWPPGAEPHPHAAHPQRTWSAHFRAGDEMVVREAANPIRERHPHLEVDAPTADGPRARVLVQQGAEAALLVVGAKPNVVEQLFVVSPLGVTLTAHAGCPVAVVGPPQQASDDQQQLIVVGVDGSANSRVHDGERRSE